MGLQIVAVCNSIAALTVVGVTFKDIDEIPEDANAMDVPMIIPKPDGFITGFGYGRKSLGPGTTAAIDITYILTYRLLHSEGGEGMSGIFSTYSDMVVKAAAFLDAVIANDTITGAINIEPVSIPIFEPVTDPLGRWFHGCDIGIEVTEFVN